MGTKEGTKIPCDISKLPEELKLPRSYVKRIIRDKQSQNECKVVLQDDVVVRCEDESNDEFQLHLRAGMTDDLDKYLEERGLEILNSHFIINLTLRESKGNLAGSNDNVHKGAEVPLLRHITGSCTAGSTDVTNVEKGENTEIKTNEQGICRSDEHNANIRVNALLLAILTGQRKSVECILKYICREIEKIQATRDQFLKVLGKRVIIENVASVTPDLTHITENDSFLNDMNLFHLSCYYFPEAIQILQELCCRKDRNCDEYLLGHLRDMAKERNDKRFQSTPLHIAARNTNVKSARY